MNTPEEKPELIKKWHVDVIKFLFQVECIREGDWCKRTLFSVKLVNEQLENLYLLFISRSDLTRYNPDEVRGLVFSVGVCSSSDPVGKFTFLYNCYPSNLPQENLINPILLTLSFKIWFSFYTRNTKRRNSLVVFKIW